MREAIATAFEAAGLQLSDEQVGAFVEYAALLGKWNARMNLTSVRDPRETIHAHFVDSCLALHHVEIADGAHVADIGSGAGFPGAPLAIMRPDVRFTLIESVSRKASFLHALKSTLPLPGVSVACERAEPDALPDNWLHAFDGVVSRYTASAEWVAECARGMTRPGGWCLVHKYDDDDERAALARVDAWPTVAETRWQSDERAAERRRFAYMRFCGEPGADRADV